MCQNISALQPDRKVKGRKIKIRREKREKEGLDFKRASL
jgi:hypothetical protein